MAASRVLKTPFTNSNPFKPEFQYPPEFPLSSFLESLITPLDSSLYPEKRSGSTSISSPEDCNELLELAAQGGIQFVRATGDGRYEVMTNNEARELMAQNSHDVTILDGEEAINLVNTRQNEPEMMNDEEDQIMVLDPLKSQKNDPMNNIELLGDKDIRVLDSKDLDDRLEIDDILTKFDVGIEVERDDEGDFYDSCPFLHSHHTVFPLVFHQISTFWNPWVRKNCFWDSVCLFVYSITFERINRLDWNLVNFLIIKNWRSSSLASHFWPTVLVLSIKNGFYKIKKSIFRPKYATYEKNVKKQNCSFQKDLQILFWPFFVKTHGFYFNREKCY